MKIRFSAHFVAVLVICAAAGLAPLVAEDGLTTLVRDGQPQAQIRIVENPPRMVALAATELADYIEKLSGARLPVVTDAGGSYPVTIYIGRSDFTDQLGIADEGLDFGAYRIIVDADTVILLGRDFDFEPKGPWPRSHNDRDRATAEWDSITGRAWGNPMNGLPRRENRETGLWAYDEGGSLNAVYGLLRSLGIRWYMPGELGEVVPRMDSVSLPAMDTVVAPDFRVRHWMLGNYTNTSRDELIWERRLGIGSLYEALGAGMLAHGMRNIQGRPEIQQAHPEYYALINGERETGFRGTGHACFSSEGLFDETVAYLRAVFDQFDEPTIQLSPQDGYRHCGCDDCRDVPPADLVFGFLDRVAGEVYTTHPDRLIIAAGYGAYREPPVGIDSFSPNLAVSINNVGRAGFFTDAEHWQWYLDLVESWRQKLAPGQLLRVENNLSRAKPFPRIHPRSIAMDIKSMKGISLGERNEIPRSGADQGWPSPGSTHLNLYVNARLLWDADQDVETLLDEYFTLFYGPAAGRMQKAFEFAELSNSPTSGMGYAAGMDFLSQLLAAREVAGESVYGERIDLILHEIVAPDETAPIASADELRAATLDYIDLLGQRVELLRQRQQALQFRVWNFDNAKWDDAWEAFALDGQLTEAFWTMRGRMPDIQAADGSQLRTAFQIGVTDSAVWVGIRCGERAGDFPAIGTNADKDPAIFSGDSVELLIETDLHSFYQVVINPAGAVLCRDLSDGGQSNWTALADVATYRGDDYWSAEIRLPITRDTGDPVHEMIFQQRPSTATPWAFNIIRTRTRDGSTAQSAFSPDDDSDPRQAVRFAILVR